MNVSENVVIAPQKRQNIIDVIKGVCIIFVIITHYSWTDAQRITGLFPYWIDMAVPFFMLISGYVNTKSCEKRNVCGLKQAYDIRMIIKKLIRFTMPFLITYVIEVAATIIKGEPVGFVFLVKNFLQGGFGPGSYYYPLMIQFVFYFPILYFLVKKQPETGLLAALGINILIEAVQMLGIVSPGIYRLVLLRYSFIIAMGIYVCVRKEIKKPVLLASFVLGAAYITFAKIFGGGYTTHLICNDWKSTAFPVALYVAPIFLVLVKKFSCEKSRFFTLLGKASFNIFLTQMAYFAFVAGWVDRHVPGTMLTLVVNVVICVGVGICFWAIEKRITDKLVSFLFKSKKAKA